MENQHEKNLKKIKHTRNIYLCYRETGTTLEYSLIVNVGEDKKQDLVYKKEKEGFVICKVLANE